MNNKDTFDILHSEFDDCPTLPDSLSKRNIVEKLKTVPQEKTKKVSFNKIASIAAAVVVVAVCAVVATTDFREDLSIENIKDVAQTTQQAQAVVPPVVDKKPTADAKLSRVESREELVEWFRENYNVNLKYNYYLTDGAVDMFEIGSAADNMTGVTAAPSAGSVAESMNESSQLKGHAETNTQTKGVDEGDIIKTDSRYIYFLGSDTGGSNKKLRIIDTQTMEAVFDSYIYDENGDILWVSDIYVNGDTLVAVCAMKNGYDAYSSVYGYYGASGTTVTMSYDITNRSQPKLIRSNTQDGSYRSSRMVGNILYTVSQYYVRAESEETIENVCIPKVGGAEIGCDCIFLPESAGDSYILLTALDVTAKDGEVSSVAVLGATGNYYCSEDTFYIIAEDYNYKDNSVEIRENTVINSFSLDGTNIAFKATGKVKGRIVNQYSLDQYEGNLRIAVTYFNNKTSKNISSLYVLNKDLDVIGKLEDIANNEQIKSVRYMGKEAYVVTFRNTDPLFAIDLSDPKKPAVKGELKIPGYSAYLHPIGDNLLLGIGYDGDSQNADFNSVKVSLFDISDPTNLKELDKLVTHKASTPVVNNPKAFLYKAEDGIVGMPVNSYDEKGEEWLYYIIQVKDNKLTLKHKLLHIGAYNTGVNHFRGTYIGEEFFTVSDYIVKKFDFNTGEFIKQVTFADLQMLVPTTAAGENKDIYEIKPGGAIATTVGTSMGHAVDEPDTAVSSGKTSQTTPPYDPNNSDVVTEPALETATTVSEYNP